MIQRHGDPDPVAPPDNDPELLIDAVRRRHLGRRLAAAVVTLLIAVVVWSMITNEHYQWGVVREWLLARTIVSGVRLTLELTGISMAIGIVLGVLIAVMRGSVNPLLARTAAAYVWFFRGTPLLVQLVFWFNTSALYPHLGLGVPFGGPQFFSLDANRLITPMTAAILGLGLNEAAYMAEIVRAGIMSVPPGQVLAAKAIGLPGGKTMRKIVLPQAMKVIVPPTGNQVISMLKTSSLVSVLAIPELLYSAQIVYARTFQTIPLLIVASIWYLAVTTVLTAIQRRIERRYAAEFATVRGGRGRGAMLRQLLRTGRGES